MLNIFILNYYYFKEHLNLFAWLPRCRIRKCVSIECKQHEQNDQNEFQLNLFIFFSTLLNSKIQWNTNICMTVRSLLHDDFGIFSIRRQILWDLLAYKDLYCSRKSLVRSTFQTEVFHIFDVMPMTHSSCVTIQFRQKEPVTLA